MARLRDFNVCITKIGLWRLCVRVWNEVRDDDVFTWGAAMAYSWLFALFPFLVFLLSLVPLLPDNFKPNVEKGVAELVANTLPDNVGALVLGQVQHILANPSPGGFLSFGLILTIWASSGGMAMTMAALDRAYDVKKCRAYISRRSWAIVLTAVAATLIIFVMILLPIGTGVLNWLARENLLPPGFFWIVNFSRYFIAILLMFGVLALIYHFGPSAHGRFASFSPGAVFSVTVWLILGALFRLYLTKLGGAATYNKTYGAVAGAAILLLFFYIDALVLLVGAEINSEIDAVLGQTPKCD